MARPSARKCLWRGEGITERIEREQMSKALVISMIAVVATITIGFGSMSSGVALAQGTDNPPGVPALRVIAPPL